jgi:large subunit ribosomal protein L5
MAKKEAGAEGAAEKEQGKAKAGSADASATPKGKGKGDAPGAEKGKGKGGAPGAEKAKGKGKGGAPAPDEKAKGKGAAELAVEPGPPPNLRTHYEAAVIGALRERFGYANPHEVPRLKKVVLNMGVGDALSNVRMLEAAAEDLATIAGQKPSTRRARKSIANFKLREGQPIGTSVTLRGARMYEFLDRLINVAIPRIRDFRGLPPKSFDGRGNYSFGVKEQIIFPEIRYDKVEKIRGMDVTIVTSAETDEEGYELLKAMRMPFRER